MRVEANLRRDIRPQTSKQRQLCHVEKKNMNFINLKSSNLFHPITNVWGVLNKGDEKQLFLAALQYGADTERSQASRQGAENLFVIIM